MSNSSEFSLVLLDQSRRLAGAWFVLALAALGASALLAVVLVAARTPFLGLGSDLFRTALVLHVDMAVLVWFLAAAAGVWVLVRGAADWLGWGVFWLASGAVVFMLFAPLTGRMPPVLANYVPVLDSRLYLGALATFFVAVIFSAGWSLSCGWRRPHAPWVLAGRWSVLVMLAVTLVFALDNFLPQSRVAGPTPLSFDARAWGAGHLLQFLHAVLLIGVWSVLGERLLSYAPKLSTWLPMLLAATALSSLGGVLIALMADVGSSEHRAAFTELMRWASWPASAVIGLGLLGAARRMWRAGELPTADEWALLLSVALFLGGCLVGATIRGNASTAVPAHYHGTVGAVTLAYLLLARQLAPKFGLRLPSGVWLVRLPFAYGIGIAVLVTGLAWAGLIGVPRKAPHVELAQMDGSYLMAMGLAGVGGFVALGALTTLVVILLTAVWRASADVSQNMKGGIHWHAILVTLVILVFGGGLLGANQGWFLSESDRVQAHVEEKQRIEIDQRFKQGVIMLQAKEYDHALTAFHRVLQLAPEMPEAYVNAGFALLGKGEFAAAADFFDDATTLRHDQSNAYYGLAVAQEGMGNLRGATEAMRTYLHRAPANDSFRLKAESALWEWQAASRAASAASAPVVNQ